MTLASWGRSDGQQAVAAEGDKERQDMAALLRFSTLPHQQAVGVQGMTPVLLRLRFVPSFLMKKQEGKVRAGGDGNHEPSPLVANIPVTHPFITNMFLAKILE